MRTVHHDDNERVFEFERTDALDLAGIRDTPSVVTAYVRAFAEETVECRIRILRILLVFRNSDDRIDIEHVAEGCVGLFREERIDRIVHDLLVGAVRDQTVGERVAHQDDVDAPCPRWLSEARSPRRRG